MKTMWLLLFILLTGYFANAQSNVDWKFSVNRIADKTYQIHLKANLQPDWHIYAQNTPKGGPLPTKISFSPNPLLVLLGKTHEVGELMMYHEDTFGVDVYAYTNSVDFVQTVKLKVKVKTNINGFIQYMICTNRECMPPATVKFDLLLKP
ncbi:disulfide bond corrector protein DsbC [Sediminibacterium magnilacihabitans]|nr:disulfide bond corrector protein DsbC [Sediminibacterium magnilacihabitans]